MGFIRLSNNVLISNNKLSYFTCQAIYYLFVFNVFFVGTRISPTTLVIGPIHLIDTALTLAPPIGGTTHSNGGILAGIVGALYGRMGVENRDYIMYNKEKETWNDCIKSDLVAMCSTSFILKLTPDW